ncbi:O-antigen ligase [Megamonas rupellensis]|uniref:O-antigen ligase domain-containing protein n=1 Tax=Megamonas rupellensis TaxID=491921 RepID=A0A411ZMG0_9FIRM|nr:O-antigen ligase family protein [Megamonas rupellensis]RGQ04012.1 O-antigen ligase domain-containing protein [Megamonas rupellensis]
MNIIKFLQGCIFFSIILSIFDGLNIKAGILQQGFIYPTVLGIFFFFLWKYEKKESLYLNIIHKKYALLIMYIAINSFININNIIGLEYKGLTSESRLVGNILVLVILFLLTIYYYNVLLIKKNILYWIYKATVYGMFATSIYGLIQLAGIFQSDIANNIYHFVEPYVNIQMKPYEMNYPPRRLVGFSKEGSTFGNYMSVIFPWIVMGLICFNKKIMSFIMIFLSIIFVIFSYSRIAYGCIFLELLVMLLWVNKFKKICINLKFLGALSVILLSVIVFMVSSGIVDFDTLFLKITDVVFSFSDDASDNRVASNVTRIGLQYAAFSIFIDNFLLGIGLGQFQFHAVPYLPNWSYLSLEIQGFANPGDTNFFYGTFNTHVRILAELGIIGFILWINIIYQGFKNYIYIIKNVDQDRKDIIKLIIISYIASIISFINFDIFEFFYFWLLLILSGVIVYKIKNNKNI